MNLLIEKLNSTCSQNTIADLNPAATEKEIAILELSIGVKLPADFKAYLKIHNGQKRNAVGIFNWLQALSTQRIQKE